MSPSPLRGTISLLSTRLGCARATRATSESLAAWSEFLHAGEAIDALAQRTSLKAERTSLGWRSSQTASVSKAWNPSKYYGGNYLRKGFNRIIILSPGKGRASNRSKTTINEKLFESLKNHRYGRDHDRFEQIKPPLSFPAWPAPVAGKCGRGGMENHRRRRKRA